MILDIETFINYMEQIKEIFDAERAVDEALKNICPEFGGFGLGMSLDLNVEMLETLMRDEENQWISYYIYETEFATNECADGVVDENGDRIPFATYDDLYYLLLDNIVNPEKVEECDLVVDSEDCEVFEDDEFLEEEVKEETNEDDCDCVINSTTVISVGFEELKTLIDEIFNDKK